MDIPPLYPARKQRPYPPLTDDERTVIESLWAEGLSALAIAQKINRSQAAVVKALGTAYRNNRRAVRPRPVSPQQEAIATLLAEGLPVREVARRTNTAYSTTRRMAVQMGRTGRVGKTERKIQWQRHGGCGTPEYKAWECMKSRCYKPTDRCYYLYGGRGITVCDAWRSPTGFPQFLAEVGLRPSPQHRLDRINNNGNYEPGNVRWATREEQANNTRANIRLTINGRTQTLMRWCRELGQNDEKVRSRLREGWTAEEALDMIGRKRKKRRDAGIPRKSTLKEETL